MENENHYRLENDITLPEDFLPVPREPASTSTRVHYFERIVFDGNNHVIRGVDIHHTRDLEGFSTLGGVFHGLT
jgi:hypothetical protein